MSKEKVLIESANNLFREYSEDITEGGIITALSTGVEFQKTLKGDKAESGLERLESRVQFEDLHVLHDVQPSLWVAEPTWTAFCASGPDFEVLKAVVLPRQLKALVQGDKASRWSSWDRSPSETAALAWAAADR